MRSTDLRNALGETHYGELIRGVRELAAQVTAALGGTNLTDDGDAIWSAFDSAVDGVTAAVRLMQAVLRLDRSVDLADGYSLELRIGVSAGDVSWNEGGTRCDGIVLNVARRLETDAQPRTILCSAAVPFLTGAENRHQFEYRGPRSYKGFDDEIEVWEVQYPSIDERPLGTPLPSELRAAVAGSFVGRADELDMIDDVWRKTLLGAGQVVGVGGEAGLGKSALCHRAAAGIAAENAVVLYGRVDEQTTYPYEPFVEAIRDFTLRADERPALLQTTLGTAAPDLSLIVPAIGERFGVAPPANRDARTRRHMLFEAVARWIRNIASVNPVILILDDLTWADHQTFEMTRHLLRRIVDAPVMVVYTYRPAEVGKPFRAARLSLDRLSYHCDLELAGLSEADVGELLRLNQASTVAAGQVQKHTGGNPFFVGELLRELERDPHAVSPFDRRSGFRAPRAVKELIASRAERLLDSTTSLLAAGAVCGASWTSGTMRSVLNMDEATLDSALSDAAAAEIIRPATTDRGNAGWGFSHAIIRDAIYDQLSTPHCQRLHLALAEHLDAERQRVASLGGDTAPTANEIVYHYQAAGGQLEKVIEFSVMAAKESSDSFAHDAATNHLLTALAALDAGADQPPGTETELLFGLGIAQRRAGVPIEVDRPDEAESVSTLLHAAKLAADPGRDGPVKPELSALAIIRGSRGMFTSTGEQVEVRLAAIDRALDLMSDRSALRASLLATKAVELSFGPEFSQGSIEASKPLPERRAIEADRIALMKNLAQEAVDIAAELIGTDPSPDALGPLIEALSLQVVALWRPADLEKRREIVTHLLEVCEFYKRPQATLNAATAGAQAAMEAGDFALADVYLRTLAESASELRQPTVLGYAYLRQAMRQSVDGDLVESERLARLAYENSSVAGQPDADAYWMGQLFNLRYHQGRLSEIRDQFIAVADQYPGIIAFRAALAMIAGELNDRDLAQQSLGAIYHDGTGCHVPHDLNWLATTAFATEAAAWLGDKPLCTMLVEQLTPYRRLFVDNATTFFGSVERFIALGSAAIDDIAAAIDSFERAIKLHRRRAPVLAARTEVEYAELLIEHGKSDDDRELAIRLLGSSLAYADEKGLRSIELRAHDGLERLGETVSV